MALSMDFYIFLNTDQRFTDKKNIYFFVSSFATHFICFSIVVFTGYCVIVMYVVYLGVAGHQADRFCVLNVHSNV